MKEYRKREEMRQKGCDVLVIGVKREGTKVRRGWDEGE